MLFRRAHQANKLVWNLITLKYFTGGHFQFLLLPFEIEFGIGFALYWQSKGYPSPFGANAVTTMLFLSALATFALYSVQRFVTWVLEQWHRVRALACGWL